MIKLDNVSLVFQGGSVALSNVSTEIEIDSEEYIQAKLAATTKITPEQEKINY